MQEIWILRHVSSRYGVAARMGEEIQRALLEVFSQRYTVHNFDIQSNDYKDRIRLIQKDEIELFCRLLVNQVISDDLLFELYGIPHVSILLDGVSHFPDILIEHRSSPRSVIAFVDKDSQELYERVTTKKALWIPHAIETTGAMSPYIARSEEDEVQWSERPIDILISGSWIDSDKELNMWKERGLSQNLQDVFLDISELVLFEDINENHLLSFYELIQEDEKIKEELISVFGDVWEGCNSLERYIRGRDRWRLCSLLDGFTGRVTILSHGPDLQHWKEALPQTVDATYVPDVPYEETWKYFSKAKIVMNSVPTIQKGIHERLLAALQCGAKVVTTPSELISQWVFDIGAAHDIRCISHWKALDAILLAPKEGYQRINEWIETNHTWKARFLQSWPLIQEAIGEIARCRRTSML